MARRITLDFLKTETASGAALGLAALAALVVANSPFAPDYFAWLKSDHVLQLGPLILRETISNWIKEGLMAVFFLVVGLEIKYEILRGELSDPRKLATPVLAALGGMVAPALVYLVVVGLTGGFRHTALLSGWPIPLATDIAFALAAFGLVGRGLPPSLRVFLLTLAIVDDLGAIALIAVLFSSGMAWLPLMGAIGLIAVGGVVARRRSVPAPVWVIGFAAVWYLTVRAGISTSLTAVAFAMIVPVEARKDGHRSPLQGALHDLHPYVAWGVLPLFAFAKAGVSFAGLSLDQVFAPLVLGIAAGLFAGKQIGVFGAAWLASAFKVGRKPTGATWLQVYGVSLLCGVGFTMSLFIGALAFPGAIDSAEQVEIKLGVIAGSILSATAGIVALSMSNLTLRKDSLRKRSKST